VPPTLTAAEFRRALGCFATGVTIITVDLDSAGHSHEVHGPEIHGMTANAFASVSLDPLLVLVCVDNKTRTHTHLHARKRFGINILSADQRSISDFYARPDRDQKDPASSGARFDRTTHGTPILHGSLAYLECRLHSAQDAGDHTIFIAEVEEVVVREGDPLLFFRGNYRAMGDDLEK
jgi:flavin reductase (DIM6/NTAB) family NADH-FMN oxidoreductase RutF